jgi:heat shock protein HspQ
MKPSCGPQSGCFAMVPGAGLKAGRTTTMYPSVPALETMKLMRTTPRFSIGEVVRHRIHPFRGVIFDVDPEFANSEEWWLAIPEKQRPRKDQPFYHLLAENEATTYVAYVSEQNLLPDESGEPVRHPQVASLFGDLHNGAYRLLARHVH